MRGVEGRRREKEAEREGKEEGRTRGRLQRLEGHEECVGRACTAWFRGKGRENESEREEKSNREDKRETARVGRP